MSTVFVFITAAVVTYILAQAARIMRLMRTAGSLVETARPFTKTDGRLALLVLGDSTAVGVGSESPEGSVAGRLSRLLQASVENHARSGAVVSDLSLQLAHAKHDHYDLIVVHAGGNDIIRMRDLSRSNEALSASLALIRKRTDRIVLLTAGRIGYAPMFPRFIAPLFNKRSLTLRTMFLETAQKYDVLYVDLLGMSDVFGSDPGRYYAADMLHLSGSGYGLWFEKLDTALRTRYPELFTR